MIRQIDFFLLLDRTRSVFGAAKRLSRNYPKLTVTIYNMGSLSIVQQRELSRAKKIANPTRVWYRGDNL